MIEVAELIKHYGSTVALRGLSFEVRPGRVTGFLGPNGAGKTTTLRIILGLDEATRGSATVDGAAFRALSRPLRTVGAVLETCSAHSGRTARNHLRWLAASNGLPAGRVDECLRTVGLQDAAERRVGGFSLGMRQRLSVAAALLGNPPVLLLDEPANGLDPEGVRWIRLLMRRLAAEGRTVLVSSHQMSEMALTVDHLIVIARGRVLADTSTRDFVERHSQRRVRVRAQDGQRLRALLASAGVRAEPQPDGALEAVGMEPAEVGRLASRDGLPLEELGQVTASLEEAFMRLTGQDLEYRADDTPGRGREP